ncbi:MAG: PTS sugar transporter subunit IIA [Thermosphaera sp.]
MVVEKVGDWREAVRLVGDLLVRDGLIEEKYVEAMIKVVSELGPYAAIAPGVAMPHARPEDGAIETGLSILLVKRGVNFGSPNDPVYLIIGFAAKDKSMHINVLKELAELLNSPGFLEEVKKAETETDVKKIIKIRAESLFFNQ